MRKHLFIIALLCLFSAGPAYAWGDEGHKVVCEIAISQVKPSTRAAIIELIRADGEFNSFSDACTWPDHPRKRAAEHFVNLFRDASALADDCGVSSPCVVTAIAQDFAVLSSKSATDGEKVASLKFLGHWVGDVHQPLHVSFGDDRGGNEIRVSGECTGNLHSTWDSCLVQAAVGENVQDDVFELGRRDWLGHADSIEASERAFYFAIGLPTRTAQIPLAPCRLLATTRLPAGFQICSSAQARNAVNFGERASPRRSCDRNVSSRTEAETGQHRAFRERLPRQMLQPRRDNHVQNEQFEVIQAAPEMKTAKANQHVTSLFR
jgi:hypothetical protein